MLARPLVATLFALAGTLAHAQTIDPETVVASRGEVKLTVADVDAKVRSMPPEIQEGFLLDPDRMARLIDAMLLTMQLARAAEARGEHETAEFAQDLALQRTELLSRRAVTAYMAEQPEPRVESLARERFLSDPEKFRPAPHIEVRHILFHTDGREEAKAKAAAEEFLADLAKGADFAELAKAYVERFGDDALTEQFSNPDTSRLDTKFAATLMTLRKAGDVAGPIRSRFGWHVVRLDAYQPFDIPPFEQVKAGLIKKLADEKLADVRASYLASFSKLDTQINGDAIRALPTRYAPDLKAPVTTPAAPPAAAEAPPAD